MVESTRWGILYCPKKRILSSPRQYWQRIEKALAAEGIIYDFVQSEATDSVSRLVKMFINNGYKTVIIVGGDSALNDTVNALMQEERKLRDEIAVGLIPNGMMDDFARFWCDPDMEVEQMIHNLAQRRVRRIDLGCIHYRNSHGEACRRYFTNCVNIGFVASIMNLRRKTHHLFGSRAVSFLFSFALLIFQRLDYKMRLHINDDDINRRVMTVCVGNCTSYGQTPNAVPYNGLLDVSVVYHPAISQLFEGIYMFVRGKFLNHKSVHPYRTREVVVDQAEHALVGIDGRLMRTPVGPYKIQVEQEVINFILPA